jgi:LPXTG-motif cell wall-anchored protein
VSREALFDETAAASRGLKEPSRIDWNQVLIAGGAGALGAGVLSLLRKRNKSRQAA